MGSQVGMGYQVVIGSKGAMGSHVAMDPSSDSRSRVSLSVQGCNVPCTRRRIPPRTLREAYLWPYSGPGRGGGYRCPLTCSVCVISRFMSVLLKPNPPWGGGLHGGHVDTNEGLS